jgi:hypothetical protein
MKYCRQGNEKLMIYPRHYYENFNDISYIPGNIMKILIYPRHYYENCNDISLAIL